MKVAEKMRYHTRLRVADLLDRVSLAASGLLLGAVLAGGSRWAFVGASGVVILIVAMAVEAIVRPSRFTPHLCTTARLYRSALDDISPPARQAKDAALGVTDDLVREWVKASP